MAKLTPGDVYCIPNAPKQNGDLWVEITDDSNIAVMDPAGAWWRGRTFTVDEFRALFMNDTPVIKAAPVDL